MTKLFPYCPLMINSDSRKIELPNLRVLQTKEMLHDKIGISDDDTSSGS
jgi:hypothetical protein